MIPDRKYRTVIVAAIDGSSLADEVVRTAIASARGFTGGEIHYVYVAEPPLTEGLSISIPELVEEGKKVLSEAMDRTAARFVGRIDGHVIVDFAAHGILQTASDLHADLIVVGSHDRGCVGRVVLGSVSRAVLDHAHCPVLVARRCEYPEATEADIEPACPQCAALQQETHGARMWCAEHADRALPKHLHFRIGKPFAAAA